MAFGLEQGGTVSCRCLIIKRLAGKGGAEQPQAY